ncbi:MAG: methyltransferase domain-containing protein [Xanthomonadales bacterium]|nr:methyltransferase domain-containing protein [Xanthomonadales bacterium]
MRLDVIERLPFDDAVASHVYASHLLEHLMYPGQVAAFLRECRRVLVPDGVLRLVVPDMGKFLQAVASNDKRSCRIAHVSGT